MAAPVEIGTLSRGDEAEAWQALRSRGDQDARTHLVERYMPLARRLARRYHRSTEPMEDLVQVASLGLVKAVDRFDPDYGRSFMAFAIPTILGELRRYFRDTGWAVHVPRGDQERAMKIREARDTLRARTGRAPNAPELAEFLEMDVQHVTEGLVALQSYAAGSLDAPLESGGDQQLTQHDAIGEADPGFELAELGVSLEEAMRGLDPSERELLQMRFIGEMSQTAIAERIGVSQMQVSRMLARTTARLREIAN